MALTLQYYKQKNIMKIIILTLFFVQIRDRTSREKRTVTTEMLQRAIQQLNENGEYWHALEAWDMPIMITSEDKLVQLHCNKILYNEYF